MLRSIAAITFMLLVPFSGNMALAGSFPDERALSAAETTDDTTPGISGDTLPKGPAALHRGQYTLKPNTRITKQADLKSFCFSPVDSVVHYIGANIGEDEPAPADDALEPLAAELANEEKGWIVQLGAGVERQLSERAAFDIDYRYKSSPVEFDLDTFQVPSGHEHHISAGMKLYF